MNTPEQMKIARELAVYYDEISAIADNTVGVRKGTVTDIVYILCEVYKDANRDFSVTEFFNAFLNGTQKS